ncbi:hypothetical protein TREMEDRAFT_40028 [Tremella mesenterica DSM 1558]|uniref:uncharacterized protein n=1 Tax=Tremella mesenterica (strain ATCC 24925 / CBS 8224 / DSM 1558 / NBRC 9311 / NRRL Y-6157 / RJB 2259-6 / UBC 559-6) TaxID=578456 RepID=UPI0003F49505|nr:uncharacterized protein TREMEDRAFT_40028 [Tremella mesenterica DSM 1558]EIW67890.1 hypothetical protein TREMEDRAFT_40028 [Tremella mesenterica DSM 1558]
MDPHSFRFGLAAAGAHKRSFTKRSCNLASGDLYTFPNSSSTVDATQPLTFKWNTDCDVSSNIDLYLYAPSSAAGLIHAWTNVQFSSGEFTATLQPKWWNDTTTAKLQLNIIESGGYSFLSSNPLGPVFTVNYAADAMFSTTEKNGAVQTQTAAAAATNVADAVFQDVSDTYKHHGISKGGIAAAVLVPLLVLLLLAAVGVKFWRSKEKANRQRWSKALSTHSGLDWEKGARPGEKPQSILGRPSMSTIQRPTSFAASSTYAIENNMAGAGAGGFARPDISGLRSVSVDNIHTPPVGPRQSRISFAEAARPDRRSRLSFGGDLRPTVSHGTPGTPVFRIPGGTRSAADLNTPRGIAYATGSALDDAEEDLNVSPTQKAGPQPFADAEMKRVGQGRRTGRLSRLSLGDRRRSSVVSGVDVEDFKSAASARGSVDELRDLEAVMLARRSVMSTLSVGNVQSPDNNHVEALGDLPPIPSPTGSTNIESPETSPVPAITYGPDQMLAVYAARAKSQAQGPLIPEKPQPNRQNSGMRLLTSLGKKNADNTGNVTSPTSLMPPPPAPGDMKSYVHLNRGTVPANIVESMPHPGPPSAGLSPGIAISGGRGRSGTVTRQSDASAYSDDVGRAA